MLRDIVWEDNDRGADVFEAKVPAGAVGELFDELVAGEGSWRVLIEVSRG